MRGKFMSTAAILLLAWNSGSFAVTTELRAPAPKSGVETGTSLPLPSVAVRSELTQQLMEVAMAGIHPAFAKSWLQLTKQPELAKNPETYYQIYSLLHQFRHQWHALDGDSRERFHFKNFNPVLSAADRNEYIAL